MKAKRYETREAFICDVSVLVQNSEQYNGPNSVLTDTARKMLDHCLQTIAEVLKSPVVSVNDVRFATDSHRNIFYDKKAV